MNQLMEAQETMSSLQIAEITGKQHSHVLRDIRKLMENINKSSQSTSGLGDFEYHRGDRTQYKFLSQSSQEKMLNFAFGKNDSQYKITSSVYKDANGQNRAVYNLNKKACLLLASGYNVILRSKIIDRWEELERKEISENKRALPQNYLEALEALVETEKQRMALEAQNQELEHRNNRQKDIIEGLTNEISVADLRQRIVQIVQKGGVKDIKDNWILLYREFDRKFHINVNARMNNSLYKKGKMDYIQEKLNMIPQLYDLTCKLFESNYNQLIDAWGKSAHRAEINRNLESRTDLTV